MKNTLKNLIYVADYFDSVQMHEESTVLTRIAKKIVISQEDDFDPEEDPIDVDMADDLNTMDDEMIELQKILDELGLSDDQKQEIMDIVESVDEEDEEDGDVKEFSFEDDMQSEQMMEDADMQNEGNQAVFENAVLEGEDSDADMSDQSANDEIESLLADDPELLKWYRSLGQ
jgi:hypothetical protein